MNKQPDFIQKDVLLAPLTTYRIGGRAQYLAKIDSLEQLAEAVHWAEANDLVLHFLGGGSNLLISDRGIIGLVLTLTPQKPCFVRETVEVGSGYNLTKLVTDCVDKGLAGLEWAAGIPGQVGGAVRGNAGAFGGSLAESIIEVIVYNIQTKQKEKIAVSDCRYGYRHSIFKEKAELLIWSVKLKLQAGERSVLQKTAEEHCAYRRQRHPCLPSAGCVFKNVSAAEVAKSAPVLWQEAQQAGAVGRDEVPAGFIIAQAGLAGYSIGAAQVSRQHANFLVNTGGATAKEMKQLIDYVQNEIKSRYKLELILEVMLWM
jgi:UDP-N-acetylmuramate dehydrogenase